MAYRKVTEIDHTYDATCYRVGIFGSMGSGKSMVLEILDAMHLNVLDADAVNASLAANKDYLRTVATLYPPCVREGVLDKAALREWVWSDDEHRRALMAVVHPIIAREIERRTAVGLWYVEFSVYVEGLVPLDESIVVRCSDREEQVRRVAERGGYTRTEARRIIERQEADGVAPADASVIRNDGDVMDMAQEVVMMNLKHRQILKKRLGLI